MNILAFIWLGIIGLGVILYVILDGFGLGIGLISPFFKSEEDKDIMVSTLLPIWDGNETWLVFVGAALYGAFPLAFSTILPAFYIPILIMVIALVFRGTSFEFRLKTHTRKDLWNNAFFIGSLLATIAQALILAGLLTGFAIPTEYASFKFHEWFNGFGLFCAFSMIIGYALLGSNRLILKTSGKLQEKCFYLSKILQVVLLICMFVVIYWTQAANPDIRDVWFHSDRTIFFWVLFGIGVLFSLLHFINLNNRVEHAPYWLLIGFFLVAYAGLLLTIFPYIIPHKLTYIAAAADDSTLLFMLVGAAIMLPILLYYTYYAYKIFEGKTSDKIEY